MTILAKGVLHPVVRALWWAPTAIIVAGVLVAVVLFFRRFGFSLRAVATLALASAFAVVLPLAVLIAFDDAIDFGRPPAFFLAPASVVAIFAASGRLIASVWGAAARGSAREG